LVVYFLITLNQQAEQALQEKELFLVQQNEQLEKVNQELDRFVYSVSHDLRSPLSSILGLTNLAKRTSSPEERQEYLSMIEDRIKVQDQFIHDIMEYSRNVRTHLSISEVNVTQLVREVKEGLRFVEGASRIAFHVPGEDVIVRTDLHRMNVILSNLIGNAIKYHDLKKDSPYIKIDVGVVEGSLLLEIADNGHGIEAEHQARVFDMFYRATELSKGSGLGLYIVKEAIGKLGGSIELQSQPGEGTRFKISVPLRNVA
jgi:signal transduction histidine kinase